MSTIKIHAPAYWREKKITPKNRAIIWNTLMAFAHSEVKDKNPWFRISIVAQFALFLPLLLLLIFWLHAPVSILAVIIALFFSNFITGLTGSGMRAITSVFALALLDLLMLAVCLA